ncbi:MAG TPA: ATP-binding protein [Pyrinomonadaceae bacterium]|nr:ATP-binding protein [Pyrinomonadaceae bacterium]
MSDRTHRLLTCIICQKPYDVPPGKNVTSFGSAKYDLDMKMNLNYADAELLKRIYWTDSHCPQCFITEAALDIEENARFQAQRRRQVREDRWPKLCPPLFREIDVSKLPTTYPATLERVMAWQMGPKGLILSGITGKGKTRAAWQLLKRLHFEGVHIRAFDCVDFAHECQTAFTDFKGEGWAKNVAAAELVFFDDFGKNKMTDRVEVELFGVIDRRMAHQLPIIVTTNDIGSTLEARLSPDRGAPLVRRLRECCESIAFV